MPPVHEFVVGDNDSDRLDRVIAHALPGLSRTTARRLIGAGAVFVNRRRCRIASRIVHPGDSVSLATDRAPAVEPTFAVLREDAALIAVDKPAGIPSAPTRAAAAGTVLDALQHQLRRRDGRPTRLWLTHRLDAPASGVIVFAKTRSAAAALSRALRERTVDKVYLARVYGEVSDESGRIDTPLRQGGRRTVVADDGRPARTDWRVLRRDATTTLVELRPHSGRLHQLRVHLRSIGHPIVGDRLYGGPPAPRLMLHALRIGFRHPNTGEAVAIETPWPAEFGNVVGRVVRC